MLSAVFINYKTFALSGDETFWFNPGQRVKATLTSGDVYGNVVSSTYDAQSDTTTIVLTEASTDLDDTLTEVTYGKVWAGATGSLPTHAHNGESVGGSVSYNNLTNLPSIYTQSEVNTIITNTSGTLQTQITQNASDISSNYTTLDNKIDTTSGTLQNAIDSLSVDHDQLNNLDYASSGHTGFQPAGDYVTETEFTVYSGTLQTQIDENGVGILANSVLIVTTSGVLQGQLDELVYSNIVTVAKSGGQYNTIQSAIDSITDAAADNRYVVKIYPGDYEENIVLKNYVNLVGEPVRRTTRITSTGGTLLTLPDTEAHTFWVDFYQTPTSDSDKLIDATTGSGITGFYRIENSDMYQASTADVKPTLIDAEAGTGLYLINDTSSYYMDNTSTTGTHRPIFLRAGNKLFYQLRSIHRTRNGSATADIENIHDESTGRILQEICTLQLTNTHASYSGFAKLLAVYGGVGGGDANIKQMNNVVVECSGAGSGSCCVVYYDSDTNDGILNSSRNLYKVSGYQNNYRYYVGAGDSVLSYFNRHQSDMSDVKISTGNVRMIDVFNNDDFIISEKIGIGTTIPDCPVHIQGVDARIRLSYSSGDTWDIDSNSEGDFKIIDVDTTTTGIAINPSGGVRLTNGAWIDEFSTDDTLADNSDSAVPTEKAVKTYVDNKTWTESDITDLQDYVTEAEFTTYSGTLQSQIDLNTTHRSSNGTDHTYIDQDVTSGSSPTFVGTNFTGIPTTGLSDGTDIASLIDNSIVNTLHRHSELVASDGSPDPALSVDAAGNVGIGTDSPQLTGHIYSGSTQRTLALETTNTIGKQLALKDPNTTDYTKVMIGSVGNELAFYTGDGSEYVRIDDAGNVGIGETSPGAKLDVNGDLILQNGVAVDEFSTDDTLAGNSDLAVPTEQAVKTYVDNKTWTESDITDLDKYTQAEVDALWVTWSGTINHNTINNTHNLTTDIDHDQLTNFSADEHFTEASIDHTNIQNIGSNSHATIDTHIADGTKHYLESSIDHTAIQNIGSNSHATIDSHISDSTIHYTEASIDKYTQAEVDSIISTTSGTLQSQIDTLDPLPDQTGHDGHYLTTDGAAAYWAAVGGGGAEGTVTLASGITSKDVTYPTTLSGFAADYSLQVQLENTVDAYPSAYMYIITARDFDGFTVVFSSPIDTANYKLHYVAGIEGGSSGGITNHSNLTNLDYASAGHTGFEPTFSKNTAFNKNFGTTATEVCVGNDSRLSDARTPTSHNNTYHSETYITSVGVTYESLNTNGDIGSSAGTVCAGDDSRLSDARTPISHNNTYHSETYITSTSVTYEVLDGNGDVGSSASTLCAGDDSRLSDARTPVSHNNTYHSATYIVAADVTYENLNGNGDVGTGATQVAQGDHSHAYSAITGTHGNEDHSSTFITASDVTYENLNSNGDVGTGSAQVAQGDHTHTPKAIVTIVPFESDVDVATGDGKVAWTVPVFLNGLDLTDVIASVHTQGSSGTTTVMIRRRRAGSDADMLTTGVTVSYNEYYANDESIDTGNDDLATGDCLYVDVDTVATGHLGLSVTLSFS